MKFAALQVEKEKAEFIHFTPQIPLLTKETAPLCMKAETCVQQWSSPI